ncbi:hypothetical protein V6246_15415 [Algibacter sp. TI.3.09]|uniref:hypothetical protein n=1 Tax=Algibacter sp. TI.3.09 TaxID=3121298 RepID=UPI00311EA4B5
MNDLNAIVSTFSTEEEQFFISYLEKKNKRSDVKNIKLFKLLLSNELPTKAICIEIYGTEKSGAYHALRKRLYQSIIDFIANSSLQEESSTDMQIIKYILAARKCLQHKQYKVAYKILNKAELLAKEHFLFPMLNEIYHTKIQYAYANPSLNLEDEILKFKQNQKNHYLEDELNVVYSKVRQTLNSITYQGAVIDFETILNQILIDHNISITEALSFKSLYQLMSIIGLSAFVTNDYLKTEPFLIKTYETILQHKNKDKQIYYHIQILYLIANTLFRNKKFSASQHYLKLMLSEMQNAQNKYFNSFILKHHLLLGLNLNFSNKQNEAILLLEQINPKKHDDIESLLGIRLSLIVFYFQNNEFKKAHQLFSKFYHTDNWYTEKKGKEWTMKKNIIEILLHIELNNIDLVESRLLSFKRSHFNYLKSINQERVIIFLGFVEQFYKNPESITSEAFKNTVEQSFVWISNEKEDIFVMSFYAWLKSKMESEALYLTTLNLTRDFQEGAS